ncbi:Thioredoxin domain-containing protein 11 [Armadillidium vulgare]|nr:Thioredoxin domain-containing protein 11 [Armadillidium vulgare]
MEQKLTRNTLAVFAYNFTHNLLNRGKRIKNIPKNDFYCNNEEICIMEVNAENYVKTISRPKQTLGKLISGAFDFPAYIALHYSHHCGACSAIGNVLLTCRHLTSDISNLDFVRIDVSKNTLPWHFSFDSVPTIVFHPHDKYKKSQTRIFNPELPITVRNLMSFIVFGLRPAERNALALKMCNVTCRKAARSQSLLMKMKLHHSLNIITHKLKRNFSILVKIQMELFKNPNNTLLQSKYNLLLEIKSYLINKISLIKAKLSHLNKIDNLYPIVPFNYF